MTVLLDTAGRRRSPVTMPGSDAGRPPGKKGCRARPRPAARIGLFGRGKGGRRREVNIQITQKRLAGAGIPWARGRLE
jgi:hypothetical protein